MTIYILITLFTILVNFTLIKLFKKINLIKTDFEGITYNFSGGTSIFISLAFAFYAFFFTGKISFFKFAFFIAVLFSAYILGMISDLLANVKINFHFQKSGWYYRLLTENSNHLIQLVIYLIFCSYIYFFLNEEYWLLKGILTWLLINLFNTIEQRGTVGMKLYAFSYLLFSFSYIRWSRELFILSFIVVSIYFVFDTYRLCSLGDSGSNLIGFIIGIIACEAVGTNFSMLIFIVILIITVEFVVKKAFLFRDMYNELNKSK